MNAEVGKNAFDPSITTSEVKAPSPRDLREIVNMRNPTRVESMYYQILTVNCSPHYVVAPAECAGGGTATAVAIAEFASTGI